MDLNVVRGIASSGPAASRVNHIGSMVTSVAVATGGNPKRAAWRMTIQSGVGGEKIAELHDAYGGGDLRRAIVAGKTYTNDSGVSGRLPELIPGLTVVLGATVNVGDVSDLVYTDVLVVNT